MMLRWNEAIDFFVADSAPISFSLAKNSDPIRRETIGIATISAAEFFHPAKIAQAVSVDADVFFALDVFEFVKGKANPVKNFHDEICCDEEGNHDNRHQEWD